MTMAPALARAETADSFASASILEPGQIGESAALTLVSTQAPSHGTRTVSLSPAVFDLAGPSGQVFSTQVSSSVTASNTAGGAPVAVALTSSHAMGQMPGAGAGMASKGRISVQGDMSIAEGAEPGLYTGLLYVVVGYN